MTLLEALRDVRDQHAAKHGFEEGYTERAIDRLSNYELLCEISEALEAANVMPNVVAPLVVKPLKPLPPLNN